MATDTRTPTADDNGWPTGDIVDIDEGVASADGNVMSTTVDDDTLILSSFTPTGGVADGDTVTQVDIVVRCREGAGSAGSNRIGAALYINSTLQSESQTGNMSTAFSDETLNHASWNSDWTEAQLNALQVYIYARQVGKAESATWEVDAVDVVITYTPSGPGDDEIAAVATQQLVFPVHPMKVVESGQKPSYDPEDI